MYLAVASAALIRSSGIPRVPSMNASCRSPLSLQCSCSVSAVIASLAPSVRPSVRREAILVRPRVHGFARMPVSAPIVDLYILAHNLRASDALRTLVKREKKSSRSRRKLSQRT